MERRNRKRAKGEERYASGNRKKYMQKGAEGGQDWLLEWNRNLSSLAQTEFRATQQ